MLVFISNKIFFLLIIRNTSVYIEFYRTNTNEFSIFIWFYVSSFNKFFDILFEFFFLNLMHSDTCINHLMVEFIIFKKIAGIFFKFTSINFSLNST